MVDLLKRGREHYGVVATKAEFEAEGTRTDELLRLLEIAYKADVDVALKIGGCEAIRDLLEAKQLGVSYIIAPMVETPYALSKYVQAINRVFTPDERADHSFLFNIETITAYNNIKALLQVAKDSSCCAGAVFGRVDFVGSLGLNRTDIESPAVLDRALHAAELSRSHGLDYVVGGAVSIDALASLKHLYEVHLSRFETRKVVFTGKSVEIPTLESALRDAVHYELLWLINKREYYGFIHMEDQQRIQLLERRWQVLQDDQEK